MTNPAQQIVNAHGKVWIGPKGDIYYGQEAQDALNKINDTQYWDDTTGITEVPHERWQQAQQFERNYWLEHQYASSDRNNEHQLHFRNYEALPPELGSVIEFGCGPFTQLATILQGRTADRITLLDPLIHTYLDHDNCTYKEGKLQGQPVELLAAKAEDCKITNEFNTAICINVLEHVQNVAAVLEAITRCLIFNGYLVFADRHYDDLEIRKIYDAGHPIRVKKKVLRPFLKQYNTKYYRVASDGCIYFIGTKKILSE